MESQECAGDRSVALVAASLGAEKATRFLSLPAAFSAGVFVLVMIFRTFNVTMDYPIPSIYRRQRVFHKCNVRRRLLITVVTEDCWLDGSPD